MGSKPNPEIEDDNPFRAEMMSMKAHCTACQAKCCNNSRFVVTEVEHDRVIKEGHPDHFEQIEIEEGLFYVLDYKFRDCSYLNEDKSCSIQDVKPDICRAFPVVPDGFGWPIVSSFCPAKPDVTIDFFKRSKELVKKIRDDIPFSVRAKVINVYQRLQK